MVGRLLCGFGLFIAISPVLLAGPINLAAVEVDMSSCAPAPFPTTFNMVLQNGMSTECFISTFPIFTIDFSFAAPPAPADITCTSALLPSCTSSETGGITNVHLSSASGPGIVPSEIFDIVLTGFQANATVQVSANTPEPDTLWLMLIAAGTLTVCSRRARRE